MKMISPLLKHVVYPGLAMTGHLRRSAGAGPAVVTYHGVLPANYKITDPVLDGSLVTAEALRQQLGLLKTRYNVISPQQFLLWCELKQEVPPRSVLLTCDDGLQNTLTDMLPILQEMGLSCLFFVTGASLGDARSMLWYEELYLMFLAGPEVLDFEVAEEALRVRVTSGKENRSSWWNVVRELSQYESKVRRVLLDKIRGQFGLSEDWRAVYGKDPASERRFYMLNAVEVRRLASAGMCIGAHTLSHPMLSQLPADLAWNEISEGRRRLEQVLGQPVWALAYPFGDPGSVTARECEMAERAGFKCAFLNVGGGFGAATPQFSLPRVHVPSDMGLAEFEAHVSGFYRGLRRRLRGKAENAIAVLHG